MNVSILSVFPELYTTFLSTSLLKKAQEQKLLHFDVSSFRDYVRPLERIDAPTYGRGAGMLIKPVVVEKAILQKEEAYGKAFKIFLSPHGRRLNQKQLRLLSQKVIAAKHLMVVAGRYEGMDARVEQEYADEIISVGDFVVMGGDIPAMLLLEGLLRLVPGVVGKKASIEEESFTGPFVDYPEYTEPVVWRDRAVPDIVRSGNHGAVDQWRTEQAVRRTLQHHFGWLRSTSLDEAQKKIVSQSLPSHYVVLMHDEVLVGKAKIPGKTSVTSLDIHDIARSAATYAMKKFFIVTPLIDQKKIVNTLLHFWQEGIGVHYNPVRHRALKQVELQDSLQATIDAITTVEGVKPLVIATSAQDVFDTQEISFYDQGLVWSQERPVILLFGTGQGLSQDCLKRCDYQLPPIKGLGLYNHLSVRSAVAAVCDRWLGMNERIE